MRSYQKLWADFHRVYLFHFWFCLSCLLAILSVSHICSYDLLNINRSVAESCCSCGFSCAFSYFEQIKCFWSSAFDFVSVSSVSAEASLNCISRIQFSCSFFCLGWINIWFMVLISLDWTVSGYDLLDFSRRLSKPCCSLDLDVSSFDFESIIFVYFVCNWCLFTT